MKNILLKVFTHHNMLCNKIYYYYVLILLYAIEIFEFSFIPLGTQGPAHRYSSPEHSGGALQLAAFSRAGTLSLRKHFHARIWRP